MAYAKRTIQATRRRYSLLTVIVYILIFLVLLFVLFIGIGGWIGSGKLLQVTEKWYAVTLRISAITEETVTLPRQEETAYDGIYGLT